MYTFKVFGYLVGTLIFVYLMSSTTGNIIAVVITLIGIALIGIRVSEQHAISDRGVRRLSWFGLVSWVIPIVGVFVGGYLMRYERPKRIRYIAWIAILLSVGGFLFGVWEYNKARSSSARSACIDWGVSRLTSAEESFSLSNTLQANPRLRSSVLKHSTGVFYNSGTKDCLYLAVDEYPMIDGFGRLVYYTMYQVWRKGTDNARNDSMLGVGTEKMTPGITYPQDMSSTPSDPRYDPMGTPVQELRQMVATYDDVSPWKPQ
jgi:hypothetical protein